MSKVNKLELPAAKTSNRYFMEISRNCIFHRKSSLFCTQKIYTFASGCVAVNVMDEDEVMVVLLSRREENVQW